MTNIENNLMKRPQAIRTEQLSYINLEQFNKMQICLPVGGARNGVALWKESHTAPDTDNSSIKLS